MSDTTPDLTEQQEYVVFDVMPATVTEIAEELDCTTSYVWDIAMALREKGLDVSQNSAGEYFVPSIHSTGPRPATARSEGRLKSETKAKITREAKSFLSDLESELASRMEDVESPRVEGGLPQTYGNQDLIIHRTDDHFGQLQKNQYGEITYNSEIAEARVRGVFDSAFEIVNARKRSGVEFDAAHLLLGGDIVTNESIYEGQAHEIDENIRDQIRRASQVYIENIKRLAEEFPAVQVVATPGNHGELRTGGASNHANADTILYDNLELAIANSDYDNVQFVQSHAVHYVDFTVRDWDMHMRHGHDASLEHIGTSAGKQRWLQWLDDHQFDAAFRGHYHMYKEEPVSGRPVHMGGSIAPQSDFEESRALSGRPVSAIHGSTDIAPTHWTEKILFER